ncbi:DNA-methyltransferase [Bacillus velezensis]|uniref:DNA-methyltransferase n=1 Tax=Bacillus velezensis TaxID=492670 RepID=UPI001917E2EC|nr:site-specific DNA-methyltransferase [Bacillus velezensis]
MLQWNKIYKGDSFELLNQIDDGSVDLMLTDPPYNISVEGGKAAYGRGRVGIDFGEWDYNFDTKAWINLAATKMHPERGQVMIFNSFRNMELMSRELEKLGYTVRALPYWYKTNPIPHAPNRLPLNTFEQVLWATRGNDYVFNVRELKKAEDGRFTASSHEAQGKRFHTTQKPVSLWTPIMRIHTDRGDKVLDTFSGSGVTAVVADELRRKFIGFENDDTYYGKSEDRLKRQKRKVRTLWA